MSDKLPRDLSGLDRDAWLAALDEFGDERGYLEPLGPRHSALFCDEGPVLLVSFESREAAQTRALGIPLGLAAALGRGWSSLTILAEGPTWFRDQRLYGYFDRLVDDGFFEDFDRVIFIGSGMCAYAACAYSVAAPGATVLAFQPRASFQPQMGAGEAGPAAERYGFAPLMIEAADRAFLFFDPADPADTAHVAQFQCENCVPVKVRFSDNNPISMVGGLGGLAMLLDKAGSPDGLAPLDVYQIMRRRRIYHPYTRRLVSHLAKSGKFYLVAKATRHLYKRMGRNRYAGDYRWSSTRLAELGQSLPEPIGSDRQSKPDAKASALVNA